MGTTESILQEPVPPDDSLSQTVPNAQPTSLQQQRPRQRPSGDSGEKSKKPTRPITRISGLLVGGAKVGKRTLLQRLQGNDPFDPKINNDNVPSSMTIPFLPPPGMPTWNRILLEVGRTSDSALPKVDFLVILVRPNHRQEETAAHIRRLVKSYVHHLGYNTRDTMKDCPVSVPVCICVMINFRDLHKAANRDDDKDDDKETPLDQIDWILVSLSDELMKEYPISKERIVMQAIHTSLRNGYGLDRLHNFIYCTYLQKKREALEAQLRAVTDQIQSTNVPDSISYDEFIKVYQEDVKEMSDRPPAPKQQSSQKIDLPQNGPHRKDGTDKLPADSKHSTDHEEHNTTKSRSVSQNRPGPVPSRSLRGNKPNKRRELHPVAKQQPRIGKAALEAFLASDGSDEEPTPRKKTPNFRHKAISQSSSDDDDDDDFYYDERGKFSNPHGKDDSSSSSEDTSKSEDEERKAKGITRKQLAVSKASASTNSECPQESSKSSIDSRIQTSVRRADNVSSTGDKHARIEQSNDGNGAKSVEEERFPTEPVAQPRSDEDVPISRNGSIPNEKATSEIDVEVSDEDSSVNKKKKEYESHQTEESDVSATGGSDEARISDQVIGDGPQSQPLPNETQSKGSSGAAKDSAGCGEMSTFSPGEGVGAGRSVSAGSDDFQDDRTDEPTSQVHGMNTQAQSSALGRNCDTSEDEEPTGDLAGSSKTGLPQLKQRHRTDNQGDSDDDDDGFFIEAGNPSHKKSTMDEGSDDDVFFVSEQAARTQEPARFSSGEETEAARHDNLPSGTESEVTMSEQDEAVNKTDDASSAVSSRSSHLISQTAPLASAGESAPSSGISAAALAAIQAAQKEAEAMISTDEHTAKDVISEKPKKVKKEKKKKKEDKKKKKKKEFKASTSDASD